LRDEADTRWVKRKVVDVAVAVVVAVAVAGLSSNAPIC